MKQSTQGIWHGPETSCRSESDAMSPRAKTLDRHEFWIFLHVRQRFKNPHVNVAFRSNLHLEQKGRLGRWRLPIFWRQMFEDV